MSDTNQERTLARLGAAEERREEMAKEVRSPAKEAS